MIKEKKVLTEEEIKKLKELKDKLSNLTAQFGQLAINKARLEEAEKTLKTVNFGFTKYNNKGITSKIIE
jgi:prefoldin subunit 5